jgi:hypothetical protein
MVTYQALSAISSDLSAIRARESQNWFLTLSTIPSPAQLILRHYKNQWDLGLRDSKNLCCGQAGSYSVTSSSRLLH